MSVGIDILEIDVLSQMLGRSELTLTNLLTLGELEIAFDLSQKAGFIAAKEAIFKTGYFSPGEWHKIAILHLPSGKPIVADAGTGKQILELEISITHTQHYAAAIAIYTP